MALGAVAFDIISVAHKIISLEQQKYNALQLPCQGIEGVLRGIWRLD